MSLMNTMVEVREEQKETNRSIQTLTSDMDKGFDRLGGEIGDLRGEVGELRGELGAFRVEVRTELDEVNSRLENVESSITQMKDSVVKEQQKKQRVA